MNTTNQVCKKCKIEKSLTEYYQRGASCHRICKECYKLYKEPKTKRIVHLNSAAAYPALTERIQQLEPRLRSMSRSYANDLLEAEDIYSAMIEEILFKSKPEDSDARILTRAKWAAKFCVHKYNTYAMRVANEDAMSAKDEDGDSEVTARPHQSAEDEYIEREQSATLLKMISALPEEYQFIVKKLALGYSQREIAHELKKSDQAISSAVKNIAKRLIEVGLSPTLSFA